MKKIKEKQNRMNNSNPFSTNVNDLGNYVGNARISLATAPVVNTLRSGYSPITRWKPYAFASNDSFIKGKLSAIKKCTARIGARKTLTGRESRLLIPYRPTTEKAIYLHYPNYRGGVEGDKGIMKKMFGNITFPVGHSAIITLDEFGHAAYFEYGRYNGKDKNVIGNTRRINGEPIFGNVRHFDILSKQTPFENDSAYVQRIRKKLPYSKSGQIDMTVFDQANIGAINKGFRRLAANGNRPDYSLNPTNRYIRTCATVANDILTQGFTEHTIKTYLDNLYPQRNKERKHLYNQSSYTFFNPWSSGRLYNRMEMFGDKSYILK